MWLWSDPTAAAAALSTSDLPTILRAYRKANRLSQEAIARILGSDKSYGLDEELSAVLGCPIDVVTTTELECNGLLRRGVNRHRRPLTVAA